MCVWFWVVLQMGSRLLNLLFDLRQNLLRALVQLLAQGRLVESGQRVVGDHFPSMNSSSCARAISSGNCFGGLFIR